MDANDNARQYGDGRFTPSPEAPPRLPPRPSRHSGPHGGPRRLHHHHLPHNNNNTVVHSAPHSALPPPVPPLPAVLHSPPVPATRAVPPPPSHNAVNGSVRLDRTHVQNGRRQQNLYVDSPRRVVPPAAPLGVHKPQHKQVSAILTRDNTVTNNVHADSCPDDVITRQPQSEPLKQSHDAGVDSEHQDSVICLKCRKCKCSSCTDPRQLPSRWVCGHEVSAESVVETCTCYYCVKGAFYHMFKDKEMDDDHTSEADPCACCDQKHCCQRWCCIGMMSVCLPCLCCFPPLKCLVNVVTSCYNSCNRQGCTCPRQRRPSQTKRFLLDSSDGSSS